MKFSIIAVLALANTIVAANPIEARALSVVDTVHQLSGQVRGFTATVNSTIASINSKSTLVQNITAQASVNAQTNKIIAAIKTANATAATVRA
ncbi:hypothetical protein SGCOL_005893, partial [Colletotrichum sp. CLE4]